MNSVDDNMEIDKSCRKAQTAVVCAWSLLLQAHALIDLGLRKLALISFDMVRTW